MAKDDPIAQPRKPLYLPLALEAAGSSPARPGADILARGPKAVSQPPAAANNDGGIERPEVEPSKMGGGHLQDRFGRPYGARHR